MKVGPPSNQTVSDHLFSKLCVVAFISHLVQVCYENISTHAYLLTVAVKLCSLVNNIYAWNRVLFERCGNLFIAPALSISQL